MTTTQIRSDNSNSGARGLSTSPTFDVSREGQEPEPVFAELSPYGVFSKCRVRFARLDRRITSAFAEHGISLLRISLGIVFLWFGALKFWPGLSPADTLALDTIERLTFGLIPPAPARFGLASLETAIGVGLMLGTHLRSTLLLLAGQMLGTLTPLILFPDVTWAGLGVPTLEGQYILKNVVLVSAAIAIGATVRGGRLIDDPEMV